MPDIDIAPFVFDVVPSADGDFIHIQGGPRDGLSHGVAVRLSAIAQAMRGKPLADQLRVALALRALADRIERGEG